MPEHIKKIDQTEWQLILSLFDEISESGSWPEKDDASLKQISQAGLFELKTMLKAQPTESLIDQSLDRLAEVLLPENSQDIHEIPEDMMGANFGPWQVTTQIAQGGMGQVYLAKRTDGQYKKEVALKLLKSGQYTKETQVRFQEEMQTLAQLEHPFIARMIDGGVNEDGITFMVLERVEGKPIDQWMNNKKLNLQARLRLIIDVCEAVEYAHQNLVIHGDIKPDNILVNLEGHVKLLDFGIARSMTGSNDSKSLSRFTPGFAAPEQKRGQAITTGSDVYSLAATTLSLIGFDVGSKDIEPFKQTQTSELMRSSHNNPLFSSLSSTMQGELKAILLKALQSNPKHRYKSISEFKRELQSCLRGDFVDSYSTSRWYRGKKTWQNNALAFTVTALGFVGTLSFALYANHQSNVARQEAEKAQWISDFLTGIFDQADPVKNQVAPITANDMVQLASNQILSDTDVSVELKMDALPLLRNIQEKLGQFAAAESLNNEYMALLMSSGSPVEKLAEAHVTAGLNQSAQDKIEASKVALQKAIDLSPLDDPIQPVAVDSRLSMANTLKRLNEFSEANELVNQVLAKSSQIENLEQANYFLAKAHVIKASVAILQTEFEAAKFDLEKSKEYVALLEDEFDLSAYVLGTESEWYYAQSDTHAAAKIDEQLAMMYEKQYGKEHSYTLDRLARWAVALSSSGQVDEAIVVYKQVIAHSKNLPVFMHNLPAAYLNLGTAYFRKGAYDTAIEYYLKAKSLWPNLNPRVAFYEASTAVRMAQTYFELGHLAESEQHFESAFQFLLEVVDEEHPVYQTFQLRQLPLLLVQEKLNQVEAIVVPMYQSYLDQFGLPSKKTALAGLYLAQWHAKKGMVAEAKALAQQSLLVFDTEDNRKTYQKEIKAAQSLLK